MRKNAQRILLLFLCTLTAVTLLACDAGPAGERTGSENAEAPPAPETTAAPEHTPSPADVPAPETETEAP